MQLGPMKALLAVLAVAGYQNRDKIREVLGQIMQGSQAPTTPAAPQQAQPQAGGLGGMLGGLLQGGGLGSMLGGASTGSILNSGLGSLLDQFQQNGHGEVANSWVSQDENKPIDHQQLSQAIGPDMLKELQDKTGLSEQELLERLTRDLPKAVNDLTPDGKVPDANSFV
jgi:uncharacterized protein YidB (DUF937 family)